MHISPQNGGLSRDPRLPPIRRSLVDRGRTVVGGQDLGLGAVSWMLLACAFEVFRVIDWAA